MIMTFSKEEWEYIDIEDGKVLIDDDCPTKIRIKIENRLQDFKDRYSKFEDEYKVERGND